MRPEGEIDPLIAATAPDTSTPYQRAHHSISIPDLLETPAGQDSDSLSSAVLLRAHHVDWLRFTANWLVLAVHFVRTVEEMKLPALPGQQAAMRAFIVNLLQAGMPMFFYASGRASGFSNQRSFLSFLRRKCLRLIMPLGAAYFTILLPAALISGPFYEGRDNNMPASTWANLSTSISWWLSRSPLQCLEWLWYLPVLALLGFITYPYCLWINTWHLCNSPPRCLTPKDRAAKEHLLTNVAHQAHNQDPSQNPRRQQTTSTKSLSYLLLTSIFVSFICCSLWHWQGLNPFLMAAYCFPFMAAPFILILLLPICRRFNWRTPLFIVFPLATLVFACLRETTYMELQLKQHASSFWMKAIALAYYTAFYLQGHLEQRFMHEWEQHEQLVGSSGIMTMNLAFRPVKLILLAAFWANGAPGYVPEWGYMWTYPIYTKTYNAVSYVLASWITLHFYERFLDFYAQNPVSVNYHEHIVNMSMIVYMFHGVHIAIIGRLLVWPFRDRIDSLAGILIFSVTVVPLTVLTYFIIIQ
eukprot:Gregarina_sp_Poly_1__3993@NODE_2202_length_2492_cov_276_362474_g25_i1_p1_GENE_NODE_2202_length_2492_cov_276_362474_g25_i1NODE_2202_length_2492_cov_276_362474_g25_i1_p1_ORF_typecomplete_len527_score37_69Acyl_transf_3/PF01757_22/1_8e11Phage_holin_3_3/PF16083_5/7_1Phage_holin_3_3/PF16083_5/25_NODE_2202_length_2492_cov_276_362474_g25_i18042384